MQMSEHKQTQFMVSLSVLCDSEQAALRAVEVLSRPLLGLAIDNLHGDLSVTPIDPNEVDK
jgi:hypothetical protein